jgi:hypothetical protein
MGIRMSGAQKRDIPATNAGGKLELSRVDDAG